MGVCESSKGRKFLNELNNEENKVIDPNDQTMYYPNLSQGNSNLRPSIFNKSEKRNSSIQEMTTSGKPPELAKYNPNLYLSGKKSEFSSYYNNNQSSLYSSAQSEEELIIKGEINEKAIYKDEDFINSSFKRLAEKNGVTIVNNNNSLNNNKDSSINNQRGTTTSYKSNKAESRFSSIDSPIDEENDNTKAIINGKYDMNGNFIPNDNSGIIYNNNLNKGINNNNLVSGVNSNSLLKKSNKINVSLHESSPRIDSFLNVPKIDQPSSEVDMLLKNS